MELEVWFAKVKQARSHSEVFAILDDFRKQQWDDNDRSKMAKLYMRILENLGPESSDNAQPAYANSAAKVPAQQAAAAQSADQGGGKPAAVTVNDGPVWYEKM